MPARRVVRDGARPSFIWLGLKHPPSIDGDDSDGHRHEGQRAADENLPVVMRREHARILAPDA